MVCGLETYCTSCDTVLNLTLSSDRIGETQASNSLFVVVRSVVSATMDMGVGYAGLEKFSRYLDMPMMTRNTFLKHQNVISDASMRVVNDVMCESAQIVRNVYKRLDPSIDESGVMDLMVSFDGSWMTQGHSSLYGIGCVVEMVTGLVIDTDNFKQWYDQHSDCTINYTGSSNAIEKTAAEIL